MMGVWQDRSLMSNPRIGTAVSMKEGMQPPCGPSTELSRGSRPGERSLETLGATERAIVAKAGAAAEHLFGNPDIRGCQDDERQFEEAIHEICETEGTGAAQQSADDAIVRAKQIVCDQRSAIGDRSDSGTYRQARLWNEGSGHERAEPANSHVH